ncbi:Protein rogdi [Chionoecetes opilio]|uniref:Protein rogdi n=1 Tax=Chionoecetes opilio TaxID=41210 RepID=A0A8J4XRN8_CHIOP|nr:Protein rogdi [Chionoecetes opilio]
MSTAAHSTQDQVKCVVTVTGDTISQADINMKAAKHQHQVHRTSVTPDAPWRIQQIQDAANFLQMAMQFLQGLGVKASLRTSSETLNVLSQLIKLLQKGRSSLLIPRKKTIDDLLSSRNMTQAPEMGQETGCPTEPSWSVCCVASRTAIRNTPTQPLMAAQRSRVVSTPQPGQKALTPPLPGDIAISFYLQAHKLVLAVYHLSSASGTMKFESVQAECSVPWLTPVLVCFTTALHLAHQLRDKIAVFSQFKDFTPDSCSVSTVSC